MKRKKEEEDSNRDFSVIHFGKRQGSRKQEKEREPTRARSLRLGLGRFSGRRVSAAASTARVPSCVRVFVYVHYCVYVHAKEREENRYYVNVSKSGHSGFKAYGSVW